MFTYLQTMLAIEKIKKGGMAKLSISQLTSVFISLMDAQTNLTADEFERVYDCYCCFKRNKKKRVMDMETYSRTVLKILMVFDTIVPYKKYCAPVDPRILRLLDFVKDESSLLL